MADYTNAQIGAGVELHYWDEDASPAAWAEFGHIRNISGIGVNLPEVESNTLDSEEGEFIKGLKVGKSPKITFTTGSADELIDKITTIVDDWDKLDLKLVIPEPATETRYFRIVPLDWELGDITPDALMEMSLMGRITGRLSTTEMSH